MKPSLRRESGLSHESQELKRSKKHRWDEYCWHCHRPNGTLGGCSACFRAYHQECLVSAETGQQLPMESPTHWVCQDCLAYNNRKIENPKELNLLLDNLLKNVFNGKNYVDLDQQFSDQIRSSEKIIKPMDIKAILLKIKELQYDSIYEFLADVNLVHHCAEIVFGEKTNVLTQTKDFQKACNSEVYYLSTCRDCFKKARERADWFTSVCETPHLIVWAKTNNFPFWPAKVFTVKGNLIGVWYFGNHYRSFIPQEDIFLFSIENPNQQFSAENTKGLADCMAEVETYIGNIVEGYGKFLYASARSPFDLKNIQLYLNQMVGGSTTHTQSHDNRSSSAAAKSTSHLDSEEHPMGVDHSSDMDVHEDDSQSTAEITSNEFDGISPEGEDALMVSFRGTSSEVGLMQYIAEYIQKEQILKQNIVNERDQFAQNFENTMKTNRQLRAEIGSKESELVKLKVKVEELEKQLNDEQKSVQNLSAQNSTFEANLLKENGKVQELETKLKTKEETFNSFVDNVQTLKDDSISSLQGKFEVFETWARDHAKQSTPIKRGQ